MADIEDDREKIYEAIPPLDISEETSASIKLGANVAQQCQRNANKLLEMAATWEDKANEVADQIRTAAFAYAQMAHRVIQDVGEIIDAEWGISEDEPKDSEESEDGPEEEDA